ncbi:hypothetical protein [Staphylococcus kloosii]|jgi:hypothetical protein|uniref:hypothetical protein n=1 Tax=Staphylococcus kloosii TaxID=29384 RepID=UPI00189CA688|nr:hypothetical protein [Staphylococcus kloosii]MBF7028907.1 hypothetical protein [Staphylococcus kloosii]
MKIKEGDWVQFMNDIGQQEYGKVKRIIKELHTQDVKAEVVTFRYDKYILTSNDDYAKIDSPFSRKLDEVQE